MKTHTQQNDVLTELSDSIERASMVMLTSVDADGALHTRPMAPLEMDGRGRLWFFTDLRAVTFAYSNVARLSFTDAARGVHVSLTGLGEIDTNRARIERLWTPSAIPGFPGGPDSANLALLKFVPDLDVHAQAR